MTGAAVISVDSAAMHADNRGRTDLSVETGAQLIGHAGRDGELCALAHWFAGL
jgi:hypothetical protein